MAQSVPGVFRNKNGPQSDWHRSEGLTTKPAEEVRMAIGFTTPILPILEGHDGHLILERFWSKVDRRGATECWDWQASVSGGGYGRFKIASYRQVQAHRVALISARWIEPAGKLVMHRCDRPSCCNPAHLRFGTYSDNNLDKMSKGRATTGDQRGFSNGCAKITPESLAFIVEKMRAGWNNGIIADHVGVTHHAISKIRTGKNWVAEVEQISLQLEQASR
jgi:hypothetical protein